MCGTYTHTHIYVHMHTVIKLKALAVSGGLGGVGFSRAVKGVAHWLRIGQSPPGEAGHGDWRSGNSWLVSPGQAGKALNASSGALPLGTGDALGNCKQRLRSDGLPPLLHWIGNKSDI